MLLMKEIFCATHSRQPARHIAYIRAHKLKGLLNGDAVMRRAVVLLH